VSPSTPSAGVGVTSGAAGRKHPVATTRTTVKARIARSAERILFMGHLLVVLRGLLETNRYYHGFYEASSKVFFKKGGIVVR
jgi:hypothetical protein